MKESRILFIFLFIVFIWCGSVYADDVGVTNYGLEGVADYIFPGGDLSILDPDSAHWVLNILQITTYEQDDWVQCWGAYPWSTDSEWIVYTSERTELEGFGSDSNEICKIKTDGTEFVQLTNNNSCDSHASFVPPNNSQIVFQRESYYSSIYDWAAGIWIMNSGGTAQTNLTEQHGGLVNRTCNNKPVVSHNGSKISFHTDYEDLWVMNIAGNNPPIKISGDLDRCTKHSWSKDDRWILFSGYYGGNERNGGGGSRIYRASASISGTPTKVSDENLDVKLSEYSTYNANSKCENWPSYSPDGQWIAFHANYDDYISTLSIMPASGSNGSNVRHLVIQGPDDDDQWDWVCGPNSWSPDSKWIAFKMWNDSWNKSSIFAYNIETNEIIQLTDNYEDYRMWWSPNGRKILFKDGKGDSANGGGEEGLTRDGNSYGDDLLVINLNSAPTADAGADQTIYPYPDQVPYPAEVKLDGTNSDDIDLADSNTQEVLSYQWTQTSGDPVTLSNANSAEASFSADMALCNKTFGFELTVTDKRGLFDKDTVTVNVVCTPPTADAGPDKRICSPGIAVIFDGSNTSDPDVGDELTYIWEQTSGTDVPMSGQTTDTLSIDTLNAKCNEQLVFELSVTDKFNYTDIDEAAVNIVCIEGDFDYDCDVDKGDLDIMLSKLNQSVGKCRNGCPVPSLCSYMCDKLDLNHDGQITILDLRRLIVINPLLARDERVRRLLTTPTRR